MLNLAYELTYDRSFFNIRYDLKKITLESYKTKYEELNPNFNLKECDFEILFNILRNETKYPQKADFIHLLFLANNNHKPQKLLKAEWDEFFVTNKSNDFSSKVKGYENKLYLWRPKSNKHRWPYHLNDRAGELLSKIEKRNDIQFPNSPYLFPSKLARKAGHLTSYMTYWDSIKNQTGLPNVPLNHLVKSYSWMLSEIKEVWDAQESQENVQEQLH